MKKIIFIVMVVCMGACVGTKYGPYHHFCDDPANNIECAKWKKEYPKEYQRYLDRKKKYKTANTSN